MVGFNDHFKPPVSTGEVLQTRLAAISVSNVSLEMKLKEARVVLEELHIPTAEHAVWLEAF
jgi:chaperonin cofactor prefoldin